MVFCGYLLLGLAGVTWLVFGAWMAVGLAVYALYGYKRSLLRHPDQQQWR
jgi:APA family basic amino acid/polyamine antiporter